MTDSFISAGVLITRAVVPVLSVIGTIGNLLNIAVLLRPAFYPHACSRYLLAAAINNVFYSSVVLIYQLLVTGYQYDPSKTSIIICKVMVYAFHVSAFITPYTIICASMERYFGSSTNVTLRRFSSTRISHWVIVFTVGFLALFNLNTFILTTADPNDGLGCHIPDDALYNRIYIVAQVILYAMLPPFFMVTFGYLTMHNLRQVAVIPVVVSRYRRTEGQLALMLLLQVVIYITLNVPIAITYLMAIMPITFKTTPIFFLINTITQTFTYAFNSTSFISYIYVTRSYREEFIMIVKKIFRIPHHHHNRVQPGTQTRTNAPRTMVATALH